MEEFTSRLWDARQQLLRTMVATAEELATLWARAPGGPSPQLVAELLSRLGREKHELDEVEAARARLAARTFGTCEACARPIPLESLRALPTVRHCVACQACTEVAR